MEDNERVLSQEVKDNNEKSFDQQLRPQSFDEFIGQKRVIENISLMVESAIARKDSMDHVLFSGPPGLGKTSLAMLIKNHLSSNLHMISGPTLDKKGDLAAILTSLQANDVLFIDEIHRINISIEEILYSAMEDFRLDIIIGQGAAARTMQIDLNKFTLVGATTRSGLLSNPLRDRFMANLHFDYYQPNELAKIVEINSRKLGIEVTEEALFEVALRSRGTPRIANRILRRVRDFSVVKKVPNVHKDLVEEALSLLDIDTKGLDAMDRKILKSIDEVYSGGPVGIDALSATLSEDRSTIEEVYEPYLLKQGLLVRSPRGRVLTDKGQEHIRSLI